MRNAFRLAYAVAILLPIAAVAQPAAAPTPPAPVTSTPPDAALLSCQAMRAQVLASVDAQTANMEQLRTAAQAEITRLQTALQTAQNDLAAEKAKTATPAETTKPAQPSGVVTAPAKP